MNDDSLTVAQLLELIEETFDSFMQLIESSPGDRLEEAGVSGNWSLKDIIAHISWYETQMVEILESRAMIGSEWWQLPIHERNAKIYEENRNARLEDVLADAAATHQQLVHWIQTLSDAELNETGHFEAMPEDWIFGDILAQNTYLHYGDHAASVAKWLTDQENRK